MDSTAFQLDIFLKQVTYIHNFLMYIIEFISLCMSSKKYTGLLKGSLQIMVLKLLKENGRMYGYEITQVVKEITNGEILLTEGALYPALHKMEKEGLLVATVELVDNRARKYYSLSEEGIAEVETKLEESKSFIRNLALVLNLNPKLA